MMLTNLALVLFVSYILVIFIIVGGCWIYTGLRQPLVKFVIEFHEFLCNTNCSRLSDIRIEFSDWN